MLCEEELAELAQMNLCVLLLKEIGAVGSTGYNEVLVFYFENPRALRVSREVAVHVTTLRQDQTLAFKDR